MIYLIDNDDQEVTSPVSESDEGYFYSTGINLDQDEDEGSLSGMYVCTCMRISTLLFNNGESITSDCYNM